MQAPTLPTAGIPYQAKEQVCFKREGYPTRPINFHVLGSFVRVMACRENGYGRDGMKRGWTLISLVSRPRCDDWGKGKKADSVEFERYYKKN